MLEKIREALYFYNTEAWVTIQKNGMTVDNSWSAAAKKYLKFYDQLLES
jgi:glycogen synthase